MQTKAAVAFEAKKPLEIVDVQLDGPRDGEVLVELKATGICHTDAFTLSGEDPAGRHPRADVRHPLRPGGGGCAHPDHHLAEAR